VRFSAGHEITYRGAFRIRLLAEGAPPAAPR
jgi:hypothetical protein